MGRAQALGCMVGGGSFARMAPSLRAIERSAADIGLHLDLTERPLPPAAPRCLRNLVAVACLRVLDRRAVRAQIRAQLDAFEQAIGRAPDFVDGHQHVHQLPIVRRELLEELLRRGGASRPWLRHSAGGGGVKERVIAALGARGLAAQARKAGFAQNHALLGVYDFTGAAARYRQRLARWLQRCVSGDLLMCHPSAPFDGRDTILAARRAEFEVLGSDDFGTMLQQAGIALAPMSAILADPPARQPQR